MKQFDFNEYLDSGQLQADMNKAVREAINVAREAGLPPAYRENATPDVKSQEQTTPTTRRSA